MAGPLHLCKSSTDVVAKVHPVVLLTICDAYVRRHEKQHRVIGTLLGTQTDGVVEVKTCYAVPHNEDDEKVELDIAHNKNMYELHHRVNSREVIVGWFSTGPPTVSGSDALIHDFYCNKQSGCGVATPVHLVVDTTFATEDMAIKTYVSRQLTLGDKHLATEFLEVPCEADLANAKPVGADVLKEETVEALPSEASKLEESMQQLRDLLAQASSYVNDVVAGRREGDPAIGRYLADTVSVVPSIPKEEFESLFNDSVQDVLLVMYLSNLVRAHVALADKLGTHALPIL